MSFGKALNAAHPAGEDEKTELAAESADCAVDPYAARLRIRWDDPAAVTALGQMPVLIDGPKTSGLWDGFGANCPMRYTSPNAASHVDILGMLWMSVLAGQWRHAHITGLRGDGVSPELLGMRKAMSEDSARRAFKRAGPRETRQWPKQHLRQTYEPLLDHGRVALSTSGPARHWRPRVDNHFDPERSAKALDNPERDAWQRPD